MKNYREKRWEPASLNAGKLCEVVFSIVDGYVRGAMPAKPQKPRDMVAACRALEQFKPTSLPGDRSARIQIPRVLLAVYEVRNNRGVGHAGGDVDPNHMDATFVLYASKWLMAELVRVFYRSDTAEATRLVDALVERVTPAVWQVGGQRRVVNPRLSMKQKALLLLYDAGETVSESDLFRWAEHSNLSVFRRDVLKRAHVERLMEYDAVNGKVTLSPTGIDHVETSGLLDGAIVAPAEAKRPRSGKRLVRR
ncbi:MAG TPA: hypothetical protein VMG98_04600 [Verrucomicrobiae bacterium]|nr:hypothetical protein [Verrucomicrobiae bacterium]